MSFGSDDKLMKLKSPQVAWTHPSLPSILNVIPYDIESLLDLGCGRGIVGALCRIYRNPNRLVGMDIFEPYLDFCNKYMLYDKLMKYNLNCLPLPFDNKEFDVVTAIEIIEHLPKGKGEFLLSEMERICRKRIIVSTPNSFFKHAIFDGNVFQLHCSTWNWKDFLKRGYTIYGVGEFLVFGKRIKYISPSLTSLSWKLPMHSVLILAVKDLNK